MVDSTNVNRNTRRQPHWNGKNPAQIPDAAPRSRTALDPVAYDNLIKQHGVRVKVYRSMFCPNVKSVDGGEHNIDCTLCNGSGYLDVDPIETTAYLSNQNFQEEMTVEGYHDGNSVGGTFLGGVELQYFTRVDLIDFTQPFYERVLKGVISTVVQPVAGNIILTWPLVTPSTFRVTIDGMIGPGRYFEIIANRTSTPITKVIITNDGQAATALSISGDALVLQVPFTNDQFAIAGALDFLYTQIREAGTGIGFTTIDDVDVRRVSEATGGNNIATLSQNSQVTTIISRNDSETTGSYIPALTVTNGASQQDKEQDNLRYDCRRVNVLIDKQLNQYYQDIDFVLTPQGNINWLNSNRNPTDGSIYTVHYESVIQYRAISAMHINRFAQVPDRSTGLVAQVKMPEQWMLQKEFLIIRRDKYGQEIAQTGIYGAVIAAQPLNPAPADTI